MLLALVLVKLTGARCLVAPIVAAAILVTGVRLLTRSSRVLVDEALPPDEAHPRPRTACRPRSS